MPVKHHLVEIIRDESSKLSIFDSPRSHGRIVCRPQASAPAAACGAAAAANSLGEGDIVNFIFRRFSIRQIFIALVTVIAMLMALIVLAAYEEENANMALNRANEQRFSSFLLAAELRQSSDDLTRLARTYVVTGDPVYAQHYQTVLDIRDGRRARPQHYERIYWDFFDAEGRAPRPDSNVSAALTDLMRENGFTAAELSKLTEAKNISDTLVQIETRAMEMVKAQRAAGASANRNELEQAR